jgi:deazaflavin-dependent oxidoreductase (nitroreductase family)
VRQDDKVEARYVRPSGIDAVFNGAVGWLTKIGLPLAGSRVLSVRGRTSGEWRSTPVNPLRVGGERYLVSPRGHTQWVRNIRVSGEGRLASGRRTEQFRADEVADEEKPPILRAYLKVWAWEVGRFFENVDASSSDERLREIAPDFPVFRIVANAG